jgi:hypothetical protein
LKSADFWEFLSFTDSSDYIKVDAPDLILRVRVDNNKTVIGCRRTNLSLKKG